MAGLILLLIALLFGVSFIRVGVQNLIAKDNVHIDIENSKDSLVTTEGHIVSESVQITRVSYTVDGTEYYADLQVYTDAFAVGDALTVYYSPDDPGNTTRIRVPELFTAYYDKMGSFMLKAGIILTGFCGVFGLAFMIIAKKLRKRKISE